MTAYGVPLFDVLGRLGGKIYEAKLIESGRTIDDYFKVNGQYKIQDFVSEDMLLKD